MLPASQDEKSAAQLDMALGKSNGFGSSLLDELRSTPSYALRLEAIENDPTKPHIKVKVVVTVMLAPTPPRTTLRRALAAVQ